jgi:hypothetical protein
MLAAAAVSTLALAYALIPSSAVRHRLSIASTYSALAFPRRFALPGTGRVQNLEDALGSPLLDRQIRPLRVASHVRVVGLGLYAPTQARLKTVCDGDASHFTSCNYCDGREKEDDNEAQEKS